MATKPRNANDAITKPAARSNVHQLAARSVTSNGGPTSETRSAQKRAPFYGPDSSVKSVMADV